MRSDRQTERLKIESKDVAITMLALKEWVDLLVWIDIMQIVSVS